MKCTECPDLGRRVDYMTFICNYTGGFLSLEDINDSDIKCARDPKAGRKEYKMPKGTTYSCRTCKLDFNSKKKFEQHTRAAHEFICTDCGQGFNSKRGLSRHKQHCKHYEVAS